MPQTPIWRVQLVQDGVLPLDPIRIHESTDAALAFRQLFDNADREMLAALFLNIHAEPLGLHIISIGTVSSSLVHPREVFKAAILAGASALILAHNHPSGRIEPSQADRDVTRLIRDCGELLGIQLVDHLILANDGRFSSLQQMHKLTY